MKKFSGCYSLNQPQANTLYAAPMMGYTDRHGRYLLRLISKKCHLFSEMITANAVLLGNKQHLLTRTPIETPITLQLAGCDPQVLATAARCGEDYGYDEINLNVGCPSTRAEQGGFGVCMMKNAQLTAQCVAAMVNACNTPITVKCRIGVDDTGGEEYLSNFVAQVASAGCQTFYIHARQAISGLDTRKNHRVPPLNYKVVHAIKEKFPHLHIVINGGLNDITQINQQLTYTDGVMLGRCIWQNPWFLAQVESSIFGTPAPFTSPEEVIITYLHYVLEQLPQNGGNGSLLGHAARLLRARSQARQQRRLLTKGASGVKQLLHHYQTHAPLVNVA